MTSRTSSRLAAAALVAALVTAGLTGLSGAAFTARTSSGVSTVTAGDWTPPLVELTNPGDTVAGLTELSATASDGESSVLVGIEISVAERSQWTQLCAPTSPPLNCAWDTTQWSDGSNDLRAVATDAYGNASVEVATGITVGNAS